MTSKEIGREIGIAPSTVDNHLRVAAAKLQVGNRRQAIRQRTDSSGFTEALIQDRPNFPPSQGPSVDTIKLFPPLGGSVNNLPSRARLGMIMRIALAGTMALAAITTSISGIVSILVR